MEECGSQQHLMGQQLLWLIQHSSLSMQHECRTCHEASDNKLYRQHLTLLHDGYVGIRNSQECIGSNVCGMPHPPCTSLIQNLSLQ